jgi:O-antigen/teichoic acid export membrane protein
LSTNLDASARPEEPPPPEAPQRPGLSQHLGRLGGNRLIRQNVVLFSGGLLAGFLGFVYHAIARRKLGTDIYGEVASLVALYAVLSAPYYVLLLVMARYAVTLEATGRSSSLRSLILRTDRVISLPTLVLLLLSVVLAVPTAAFLHLRSPWPVIWLGLAVAAFWHVAVPRGALQGTQRFSAMSANLATELIVRTGALAIFLWVGFSVSGAMAAILAGCVTAYALGVFALRGALALHGDTVRLRTMFIFSLTAAAGTLGVLLLYNMDVVLAKHYLDDHNAGIYGGLNKIGTILYFGTLSVSQVIFPRVVEAVATNSHPGRLLLLSAGLLCSLGAAALLVFAVASKLLVLVLYGPGFDDAVPYVFLVGLIGLGLSLDNLLIQFLMAVHDRVFVPILASACVMEALLIVLFHSSLGQVVLSVLTAILVLLAGLTVRCLMLLPRLRPEMVVEDVPPPI